jgi:hypothetical protein
MVTFLSENMLSKGMIMNADFYGCLPCHAARTGLEKPFAIGLFNNKHSDLTNQNGKFTAV